MRQGKCPKCGHAEILQGIRVKVPAAGNVDDVCAVLTPTSGMFRQQTGSDLHAWVCGACGFAELYVSEPGLLADRWRAGER